jgi:excisionase family DNA binding protein
VAASLRVEHTNHPGKITMRKVKMYKVQEVADILAVHRVTVGELLKKGKIEGMKLGTHWRIAEDEVKRFLGLQTNQQPGIGKGI